MSKNSNHSLWGGRFTKSLDSIAMSFNASIDFDKKLVLHDIHGSQVHAEMLGKQNIISHFEAQKLINGLENIKHKVLSGNVEFSAEAEDIHMNIEQLLLNEVGDVAKKLHTSRSRNDQVALDLRLYLKEEILFIQKLLNELQNTLMKIAQNYKNSLLPGYTHLQKAQPITLECYLNAYRNMFARDESRLSDCFQRMNYSPLGAGAIAGTTLPIDRYFTAEKLNFLGIVENPMDAVSDRDFVIEFSSAASIIITHLSRFCEDIIIWASEEFGFLQLDDSFSTGSSLMPNKKNPDIPELIRGKSGRIFGNLVGILTVMKGLPLGYNKDLQEDKEGLFDTVDTIKNCLQVFIPFLESIQFQTENMKKSVLNSYVYSTHLLEEMVKNGVAFREAHGIVGKLVLYCVERKKYFQELTEQECNLVSPLIFNSLQKLNFI